MKQFSGVFMIIVALVLFLMAFMTFPIWARDGGRYAASSLKPWFDGLKNRDNEGCCSDADGTALSDVDWETRNGGDYWVRLDGEWHRVPDKAILKQPNLSGRTMVWPLRGALGLTIRCFIPGSMT